MRMLLAGLPSEALAPSLEALLPDPSAAVLRALVLQHAQGLARTAAMLRHGVSHHSQDLPPDAVLAMTRAMFDAAAGISPEASVAAYSLGDAALLAEATAELLQWLTKQRLLHGQPAVLDLGCGIGRLAVAVAPHACRVLGIDLSSRMVAEARERHAGVPNLRFDRCNGRDLHGIPSGEFHLVLAVDVFPYLMQAGHDIAARALAETVRVLRPGGSVVILNYSYREPGTDAADLAAAAARHGLSLRCNGIRPFALWDGRAHWLQRPA